MERRKIEMSYDPRRVKVKRVVYTKPITVRLQSPGIPKSSSLRPNSAPPRRSNSRSNVPFLAVVVCVAVVCFGAFSIFRTGDSSPNKVITVAQPAPVLTGNISQRVHRLGSEFESQFYHYQLW